MSDNNANPSPKPGLDRGRLVLFLIVLILAGTTVYALMQSKRAAPPVAIDYGEVLQAVSETGLKDFKVVNAHDHLYMRKHLDKYLAAAENMGITKTLFVASSSKTLIGLKKLESEGGDENTQVILDASKEMPDKIIPFCIIYQRDPEKLDKLQRYIAEGAKGVKLYSGHSQFHEMPLDADDMMPVYAWIEENQVPLCWHVGLGRYGDEFGRVMAKHPNMIVILPHFGQAYWRPQQEFDLLRQVMDTYPNVYTDTSIGTRDILVGGLEVISRYRDIFRQFCEDYSDRILFGTDLVVTGNKEKTQEWIESVLRACRDMLEKDVYIFHMAATGSKYAGKYVKVDNPYGVLRGLELDDAILKKIYETNILRLLPPEQPTSDTP